MSNYKRRRPRGKVRCRLCTDNRENIGGDRQRGKRAWKAEARKDLQDARP